LQFSGSGKEITQVGMTTKFAVLGSPISHSKSPLLHRAAYEFLGFDFQYDLFEVDEIGLLDFLDSKPDYSGFSLTMPLKDLAFQIATSEDGASLKTSVSNTLVRTESGFQAHNTDVFGISRALSTATKSQSRSIEKIAIIGTGATARSAMVAVSESFPEAEVIIWGRTPAKVSSLSAFGESLGVATSETSNLAGLLGAADLTISTVPKGSMDSFWSEFGDSKNSKDLGYLFDVSYDPWPSVAAKAWGNNWVISGMDMLIFQAVHQVRIFAAANSQVVSSSDEELAAVMRKAIS
jgi:shikimate dehydrogenase